MAEAGDRAFHHVARTHPAVAVEGAVARRRTCRKQIAGGQPDAFGSVRQDLLGREDHVGYRPVLHYLPAELQLDAQVLELDELLGNDERAEHLEIGLVLADPVELKAYVGAAELVDRADVVDRDVAGDEVIRLFGLHIAPGLADDHAQFHFPVGMLADQRQRYVVVRAAQRGVQAGPEERHALARAAVDFEQVALEEVLVAFAGFAGVLVELVVRHHLRHVLAVVGPGEQHVGVRDAGIRVQRGKFVLRAVATGGDIDQSIECAVPLIEDCVGVVPLAGKVEHCAVGQDQAGKRPAASRTIGADAEGT